MPLPSEQIYNDLTGEECREILIRRFADLLSLNPDLRPNLTLSRVRLTLVVHVEVHGRTPPSFDIVDELTISTSRNLHKPVLDIPGSDHVDSTRTLASEINSDSLDPEGQPPDQIRIEHGLPTVQPTRSPMGFIEDAMTPAPPGEIKYAAWIPQDYGPARSRTGAEGPVVGIPDKNTHAGSDGGVAPPQQDFAVNRIK